MKRPWISFELQPTIVGRKTETWVVKTLQGAVRLGIVKWFGPWRQYSFFPDPETAWERECLRTVADFCERSTLEYRGKA
jgi:hypothetical protein